MRLAVVIVAVALGCLPARAEAPGSPEALVAAKELAAIMSADTVGQMTEVMTAQLWTALEANLRPKADEATLAELRAEFERSLKEFAVEAMQDAPAVYARHFSAPELREMTAFYRTPTGAKALKLMPQVMSEHMAAMKPRIEAFTRVLQSRIQAVLTRRGIK